MGLDVRVYQNVTLSEDEDYDFIAFVIDESWGDRIKNLVTNGAYKGDCVDHSISYAYSSHNRFREALIQMMGRDDLLKSDGTIKWDDLPVGIAFYELINFADNEGCIDWETSEKLYKDFVEWRLFAKRNVGIVSHLDRYFDWLKVFKLAKNKGVVVFS